MPRRKEFLNPKKNTGKKSKNKAPESENEYLAAGVDFEEAGEKWRAGDAAKSLRFFIRATETYDAGLEGFPQSFDLAYNKARLQYEVAQQPRLLEHLPTPLIHLLQIALDSHRIALKIEQDSPDLLFNAAQVLTSLAEAIIEGRRKSGEDRDHALRLLQEALELFQRCLNLQEYKFNQAQEDAAQAAEPLRDDDRPGLNRMGDIASASNASEEEVWASVEEPITKETLLDTAIAQLDTLTILCGLEFSQGHSDLAWIEEYYHSTLQVKVNTYADGTSRQHEAALVKVKFFCALSDAAFRSGRLDLLTYERELTAGFNSQDLDLANDPQGLCDRADAELNFNASIQGSISKAESTVTVQIGGICWKHITKALDSLTAASKLPDALNLPRIHLRKGDCEMLRLRLGEAPLKYDLAVKSMPTLLKNAEVFYRGAAALAKKSKDNGEEQKEAEIKEATAAALAGETQRLTSLMESEPILVEAIAEEMREEGLLGEEGVLRISKLFA